MRNKMAEQINPDSRLKEVFYVVEATSFEYFCLWEGYAPESQRRIPGVSKHTWKEDSRGFVQEIGKFGKMPVCISVLFATIDGKLIMFYECCSMVSHMDMVRKWVDKNAPIAQIACLYHSNAQNFHNCIIEIANANKGEQRETKA